MYLYRRLWKTDRSSTLKTLSSGASGCSAQMGYRLTLSGIRERYKATMETRHSPIEVTALNARGFTMIELLVSMLVAAILFASAIPSYRTFVQNSRQSAQASSLVAGLNFARSEAVKADLPVTVCASADGATCAGTAWTQGWIVLSSANAVPANTVLLAAPAFPTGTTLTTTGNLLTVLYYANGTVANQSAFNLCDSRGAAYARLVDLNAIGRATLAQKPGFALDGTTALTCP